MMNEGKKKYINAVTAALWFALLLVLFLGFFAYFQKRSTHIVKDEVECKEKYAELYIADVQPYDTAISRQARVLEDFSGFRIKFMQPLYCNGNQVKNIFVDYFLVGSVQFLVPASHKDHVYVLKNPQFRTNDNGHNVYLRGLVHMDIVR